MYALTAFSEYSLENGLKNKSCSTTSEFNEKRH